MKNKVKLTSTENPSKFMGRKNFKRNVALSCLSVFMVVNTSTGVMAMTADDMDKIPISIAAEKNGENIETKLEPYGASNENTPSSEEVVRVKTLEEAKVDDVSLIKPPEEKSVDTNAVKAERKYTLKELSAMDYKKMVDTISTLQWTDIDGLFKYSADSQEFYGNKERVKYIINALDAKAKTFTDDNDNGIPTIVEVLRSGYYLGYYNKGLSYLNDRSFRDLCIPALNSMLANPNFKFGNKLQNSLIKSFGLLIGNTSCNAEVVNKAALLLRDYKINMETYGADLSKANAIYEMIKGISYDLTSRAYEKDPSSMPYYGKIDTFINEFKEIALMKNVSSGNQWLVDNATYQVSKLGVFYSNPKIFLEALTDVMDTAPKYSKNFFIAAKEINYSYKGINSRGENIHYAQLQEEGHKKYLPNKYTFDNGSIVMEVGDNVSEEKAKRLYWAAKEVESQFFRVIGNDKALETGNPDDVLTIKIFNSPSEYEINYYLNNVSTDNGGIYIEPIGTFYTYERTTEDSRYSLEELFRHEFTHYLQSRYLVPGMWGEGPFYEKEYLTWFDEGSAEFFAGSTRTEGVKPRKSVVSQLAKNEADRFTLSKTVSSKYDDGWDFYHYGFALASYMYNKDMGSLNKITDSVIKNDITSYRNFISQLKADSNKNREYQQYMGQLIADTTIGTPLVSDSYTKAHDKRTMEAISSDIVSVSGISGVAQEKIYSEDFDTFKISGKYVGGASKGRLQDNAEMNQKANEMLKNLSLKEWTGYETVTCYFTDYKVVNGKYEYNLVFKGLLNDDPEGENKVPTANIDAPANVKIDKLVSFNSNKSADTDGYIVSYAWDFGDGSINSSKNPTHVYKQAGNYVVTLKVIDNRGATGEATFNIKVNPAYDVGGITSELEPNDTYADADSFIVNDKDVTGTIENEDDTDVFAFQVDKDSKIDIKITGNSSKISWVVRKEDDLNKYVCHKQYTEGDITRGSFNATPGKYYLTLYSTDETTSNENYSINIKFHTKDEPEVPSNIDDVEPNNDFQSANVAIYNNIDVKGNLAIGGDTDVFYFDVDTASNVNIKVGSAQKGYAWVVCKSDNLNKNVCWNQYNEVDGTSGKFQATPGKYFIKLYSLNSSNKVDYTIRIDGIRQK
jgi:microbial collagenase